MRTEFGWLRFIPLLWSFFAPAAFGQVTQVFDGHSTITPPFPAHTNIDVSTNYIGNILPSVALGETAEFDGRLPGDLVLSYVGNWSGGAGSSGLNLHLTSNQIGSILIDNFTGSPDPANFAINNITIDAGAGPFQLASDTRIFNYSGRPGGAVHKLLNNSTNTATIGVNFHMIAGGGNPFTFDFMGTGNWQVNSVLVTDGTPNNNFNFQVDTTGTVTWSPNPGQIDYLNAIGSVTVNSGLLIMTTNHPRIGNTTFALNSGTFRFDAPGATQTVSGVVSGTGVFQVSHGTFILSGKNTFSGPYLLTGGKLIANSAENSGVSGPLGIGGLITFGGGTLGYSSKNTFDYSPRFDPASGQAYRIDTAGQSVTFNSALASAGGGLTKLGVGTLTLSGVNTYTGVTTVSGGTLVIERLNSAADITVADGAILGVTENDSQITPSTLILGTSASATLEFNNVTNTTIPALVAGTISAAGPISINVNSGIFDTPGQSYPLFSWTGGSGPAVILGTVMGAEGILSTNGNTIWFVTSQTVPPAPTVGSLSLSDGTNFVLTATNNMGPGGTYTLFGTNNLSAPLSNWPVISTGFFDTNGNLFLTNPIDGGDNFFMLRVP